MNGSATPCTLTLNIQHGKDLFVGTLGGNGLHENNFPVTKTGAGTLWLGNSVNWSGDTLIEQGVLEINSSYGNGTQTSGGTLGSANVIIASGAILEINRSNAYTTPAGQTFSGPGTLVKNHGRKTPQPANRCPPPMETCKQSGFPSALPC